jgi:uncharacterized protein YbbC (DUF1343 family)
VGLWELTNISVGRGTDTPFELIGAPWINGIDLATELRSLSLAGVTFVPIEFTPTSSNYAGQRCQGVNMVITDRQAFDPLELGFALAVSLRKLHASSWKTTNLNRLMSNRLCETAILAGELPAHILKLTQSDLSEFLNRREPYLLYK